MASLTISELRKRNNFEIFLKKISTRQPLELIKEKQEQLGVETVVIKSTPELSALLEKLVENPEIQLDDNIENVIKNRCLLLESEAGHILTSGALQKTWEFGSRTSAMVYEKESREQKNIQKNLKTMTVFGLRPISLTLVSLGGKTFRFDNVVTVRNANKANKGIFSKADFEFVDAEGNLIFNASHKFGKRPRHFRQWSGLKNFHDHPEVKQFGEDLKLAIEKDLTDTLAAKVFPKTLSYARAITDDTLKKMAIFGEGDEQVDFLIQGRCEFVQLDTFSFQMKAPIILAPDDDLNLLPEGYHPVILARRGDLKRGTFGIKGCRGMIYPKKGRAIHRFI